MIELQGTEKQVQWATKIREEKLQYVLTSLNKVFSQHTSAALDYLQKIDSCKFWIENRDTTALALGVYALGKQKIKLGLPDSKNFLYTGIETATTKKQNTEGEWVVESVKEYPREYVCLPIGFNKKGFEKVFNQYWVSWDSDIKEMRLHPEEPSQSTNPNVVIQSFRSFAMSANKRDGLLSKPVVFMLLKIGDGFECNLDLVLEP